MCSSKDHNRRYIFISVFSSLFPSHCLLSRLVFHWQRGTGGLDADMEMGWESIEAYKSNFTTRPTAFSESVSTACASFYVCAKPQYIWDDQKEPDFFVLFTFRLPLLSDLHCSLFLTSLSVPSRTLISSLCPLGLPPKISVCPLSFRSSGRQRDNRGICRASALW